MPVDRVVLCAGVWSRTLAARIGVRVPVAADRLVEQGTAPAYAPKMYRQAGIEGCGQQMHEVKLRGVPVEVCFSCNGIFLQHGEIEAFQRQINEGRRGVVAAILNWFHPESPAK